MAENLDDGEFWLPPQFLTDEYDTPFNNLAATACLSPQNDDVFEGVSGGSLFPYHLSSPVESVVGSSETESDEEEQQQQQHHHMAELTRRMAHSTLQLDLNHNHIHHHRTTFASENPKGMFVSGSPQSTLCAAALGSSGKGSSPNGSVSVSQNQANSQRATWDLLRAAAGEVERMRLNEEEQEEPHGYSFLPNNNNTGKKPSPPVGGFFIQQQQQSLSHRQLQIAQFQMLRKQQLAKQQQQGWVWGSLRQSNQMVPNRGRNVPHNNVVSGSVSLLSASAWPPKQGSGMRAVFLGNKMERTGTGVFLPRSIHTPSESRKPACSTVLVPDRVAQVLNLKLEGVVGGCYPQQHQTRFNGTSNMENVGSDVPRIRSDYYGFYQQKRNLRPQQPPVNREIRLPQEWTY